jgi:hypothetical protein
MPVRDGEQGSIGSQPVPRDRCAWPCESGNDVGVSQGCRRIGAGYRLEAYATLKLEMGLESSQTNALVKKSGVAGVQELRNANGRGVS